MNTDDTILYRWCDDDDECSSYVAYVEVNDIDDKRTNLSYDPNGGDWSEHVRGTTAASLHDNGEGVEIEFDKKTIELNYSQLIEIYMILTHYFFDSGINDRPILTKYQEIK
jgi:hypothetical protein